MLMKLKAALIVLVNTLLGFLPDSPFSVFFTRAAGIPELGYLNYFVPVGEMIAIAEAWLTCIGIFYLYQAVLRFAKMIE